MTRTGGELRSRADAVAADHSPPRTVTWTAMEHGDRADYVMLGEAFESHTKAALVDNLIGMLDLEAWARFSAC